MTNLGRPQGLKQRMRCPVCKRTFATFVPSGGGEPRCQRHNRPVMDIWDDLAGASPVCPGGGKFADPAEPLEVA